MKKFPLILMALLGLVFQAPRAQAQVQFGISAGPNGPNHFYLSIGNYFNVPPQQITVIHERDIPDDQIPVVLFIAQRAHVDPADVIELREEGFSWMEVALRFGIGPEVFYINVNNPGHSPYSRAYGYYHRWDRRKWRHIRLSDDDIVNLVNLRFVSEYYHRNPDEVVRLRAQGRSFYDINEGWRPRDRFDAGDRHDNGLHRGLDKNRGGQGLGDDHRGLDQAHPRRDQDGQWQQENGGPDQDHRNLDQDHHDRDGGDQDRKDNGDSDQDHHGRDRGHQDNGQD
jgi:hypothetical protein